MSVDTATLDAVRVMMEEANSDELRPLTTIPQVLAYVIAQARAEDEDEADMVELAVRAADMSANDVRASRRVLERLGYTVVADRLRQMAGRRNHDLAPLPNTETGGDTR